MGSASKDTERHDKHTTECQEPETSLDSSGEIFLSRCLAAVGPGERTLLHVGHSGTLQSRPALYSVGGGGARSRRVQVKFPISKFELTSFSGT